MQYTSHQFPALGCRSCEWLPRWRGGFADHRVNHHHALHAGPRVEQPDWAAVADHHAYAETARHKSLCASGRIDLIVAASLLPIPITAEAGHELIIEVVDNGPALLTRRRPVAWPLGTAGGCLDGSLTIGASRAG